MKWTFSNYFIEKSLWVKVNEFRGLLNEFYVLKTIKNGKFRITGNWSNIIHTTLNHFSFTIFNGKFTFCANFHIKNVQSPFRDIWPLTTSSPKYNKNLSPSIQNHKKLFQNRFLIRQNVSFTHYPIFSCLFIRKAFHFPNPFEWNTKKPNAIFAFNRIFHLDSIYFLYKMPTKLETNKEMGGKYFLMELFCSSSVYLFGKLVFAIGKIQLSNYRRSINDIADLRYIQLH